MIANKISTLDITNIGSFGVLKVTLPNDGAIKCAKQLVSRAKKSPRNDGLTYTTKVDSKTNTLTIKVVRPEDVNRKNK